MEDETASLRSQLNQLVDKFDKSPSKSDLETVIQTYNNFQKGIQDNLVLFYLTKYLDRISHVYSLERN